ncbi:MAG: four helix bundle protein [Candidatus Kerfeldbacteria bacterium]|nr:four helix bundle protein [Candidatus Kerfeldbacteria bacterium]
MVFDIDRKFRFRKFTVYQLARQFVSHVRRYARSFPDGERYILTAQLLRAANSIVLNIAEGSNRSSDKDFALFLNYALASLNEVVACCDVAVDCGCLTHQERDEVLSSAAELGNQLSAFRKRLLE